MRPGLVGGIRSPALRFCRAWQAGASQAAWSRGLGPGQEELRLLLVLVWGAKIMFM